MKIDRQKLIYTLVTVGIVVLVAVGVVIGLLFVNNSNNNSPQTTAATKTSADDLKSQAITALKNGNNSKAKTLFQQANTKYKSINDTNDVIDTNAQIYLIDHAAAKK